MRKWYVSIFLAAALNCLATTPAYSANKEMIELQQQMDTLLKQQQTIAESMGQLKDRIDKLTQQTTENVNQISSTVDKISATVDKLDKSVQLQTAGADTCADQVAGQVQPLHDALSELKANVDAINKQLATLNSEHQPEPPAQGSKAAPTNQPQ